MDNTKQQLLMTVYVKQWLNMSNCIHMTCHCGIVHKIANDENNPNALVNPIMPKNQYTLAKFFLKWANERQTGTHSDTQCVCFIPEEDCI